MVSKDSTEEFVMKLEQKLLKLAGEQPPTYTGFRRELLYSTLAFAVANFSTGVEDGKETKGGKSELQKM